MKQLYLFILSVILPTGVKAESTLPYGITPINGEIRLLYRPGYESTCISKNEADPNEVPTESVSKLFLDSAGRLKYEMKFDKGSVIAAINNDGSAITRGSLKFVTKEQPTEEQPVNEFIDKLFKDLENLFIDLSPLGKILKQNSDLSSSDLCKILPGGRSSFFSTFKRKVVGVVQIHGRPSLIIKSEIDTTCTIDKIGNVQLGGYGWESYDLQSGLNSGTGDNILIKMGSNSDLNIKNQTSCIVTETAQAKTAPSEKSLESRLTELKALLDKNLITQEQYEQKRTDILKSL
jgi:Short C-terminal domain